MLSGIRTTFSPDKELIISIFNHKHSRYEKQIESMASQEPVDTRPE